MTTLAEALDTYLKIDRSRITNRNYANLLTRLVDAIGPARDVKRISYGDLVDFTSTLKADISPRSFRQYVVIIKTFFKWCEDRHYLKESPAAGITTRVPAPPLDENRAIPTDLLNAMIERSRRSPRDHALLLFLADTGGRRRAAESLRISKLYLSEGRAQVIEKGEKHVMVYFGPQTALALSRWLEQRPVVKHDYVFTSTGQHDPLQADSISAVVKRWAIRCGGEGYGPHSIRHWLAESWVEAGASPNDVQHKLNHARVETTIQNYFPHHNRNVETLSRQLSLSRLRLDADQPEVATNIIPLDDCG